MSASTIEEFLSLAQAGRAGALPGGARVVPVWREILFDFDTAVSAFARLRRGPFAFLLESAPAGTETWARYTFIGTEPAGAWRLRDGVVEDWDPLRGWHSARTPSDPLADLEAIIMARDPVDVAGLGPFWGGAVGYFGYDVVRHIESLPAGPGKTSVVPDALFVFTRSVVVIDNLMSKAKIVVSVDLSTESESQLRGLFAAASAEAEEIEKRIVEPNPLPRLQLDEGVAPASGRSSIERDDFIASVDRIKDHISAGDCFQVLLSRRIEVDADFEPATLYRALRTLNPSPYMYHLVLDGVEIVGSSPELLVRLDGGRVTVRPIAGTRPRGTTPEDDARLERELLADPKERAEHVMLVDLGRNDVGRVAHYGSVEVTEFMKVERYSHVLHIVSQVEGDTDGRGAIEVLRATFPAGTMTGAPKVRAMQIIDELEPVSRGAYAGALGYISAGGTRMDLAITIRTCVIAGGIASVQAGAGIVADSVGSSEWRETESKAGALLTAIAQARGSVCR
ncbi:MAG: anthranilate synthase component I family protein [Gemmatimonadaceae bacterium]